MSNIIVDTSQEAGERVTAIRTLARLSRTTPSHAAPLTDEDLAVFERQAGRQGNQFMAYAHYAYMDYFVFYGGEMGKLESQCREKL